MSQTQLYRKRIIPAECILLKDDEILYQDSDMIVTKWKALKPKKDLHHGFSCYFLKDGFKISKFYYADNTLLYWYCDIISHTYNEETDTYIFTDLLADVILFPDGRVKVVDLDEIADALASGAITAEQAEDALYKLNKLLSLIYRNEFDSIKINLEKFEETDQ
ncbi:MAG: DUF402 domain-containing protein [Lachnospiraceae bacterium]|nr:DUF402 domain-containing protein [Lachnospiraceae bacterium]